MKNRKPDFDDFIRLSREGVDDGDLAVAPGFATRVASRWAAASRGPGWFVLWERAVSWGAAATLGVCLMTGWFCRSDFTAAARAAESFAAFAEWDETSDSTP